MIIPIIQTVRPVRVRSDLMAAHMIWNIIDMIWALSWKNLSSQVSGQVRLKLACSFTEASIRLGILVTETRDITLSRQRITKALIRLCGCAGWSEPLLLVYDIRHVFSWPGSFYNIYHCYILMIVSRMRDGCSALRMCCLRHGLLNSFFSSSKKGQNPG